MAEIKLTEETYRQLPEIVEKDLLNTLKSRFGRDFIIKGYIYLNGTPDVQVILVTDDSDRIVFSAFITPELKIYDDFQRACCCNQLKDYIGMLISDTYISVSFIEDFKPDPDVYVSYDEYIVSHGIKKVLVRLLSAKDRYTRELLETVYNVMFQKFDVELCFFCYEYESDEAFISAVDKLKDSYKLTKTLIEQTNPVSFNSVFFPEKGDS